MRPYTIFEGMFCSGDLNKVSFKRDLFKDAMHDEDDKEGGNYIAMITMMTVMIYTLNDSADSGDKQCSSSPSQSKSQASLQASSQSSSR